MKSNVKGMLIIFFALQPTVHKEFVMPSQTVNSVYYCDVLRRLRENVRRLRRELWRQKNQLLRHDSVPLTLPLFSKEILTKNNLTAVPNPPY
jgi:hypothetical protein